MKSIHVRSIQPDILAALKRLARSHHRSLQGELLTILELAARRAPSEDKNDELALITVETGLTSTWSREDIYDDRDR